MGIRRRPLLRPGVQGLFDAERFCRKHPEQGEVAGCSLDVPLADSRFGTAAGRRERA